MDGKLRITFHPYLSFRTLSRLKDNLCPLSHSIYNLNHISLELYKGLWPHSDIGVVDVVVVHIPRVVDIVRIVGIRRITGNFATRLP